MSRAYYNEFDREKASWLEENIRRGLVAPGDVDRRDIKDVQPDDLRGYSQHHFFAGIGGWSFAARLAGWDDARPLWSASLPCQPFSSIGLRLGADDSRHVWPDLYRLVDAARPPVIVGEQVSGEAGYLWLDGVSDSLAAGRYASRAVDVPALAVDSPQQRNRLYWVAVADELLGLGRSLEARLEGLAGHGDRAAGWEPGSRRPAPAPNDHDGAVPVSFWQGADFIECHDGRSRRVPDARAPLLDNGISARILAWSGFGDAIVPQLAAQAIAALADILPPWEVLGPAWERLKAT